MKRILVGLFLLLYLFLGRTAAALEVSSCVYYFYGEGCPHCANVKPVLDELEQKYPDLNIQRFEIYFNEESANLFQEVSASFSVPQPWGVPAVFIGEKYFVGDTPIITNLEDEILANPNAPCPLDKDTDPPAETGQESLETPALATIIGAALVDSINPCAIAVLLILLSAFLFGAGKKKRAVAAGLAFTAAIYLAYFLFGLGIFSAIQFSGLSDLVYRLVGILAIIVGLLNIKDYFWYGGGGFAMEIPQSWRHALKDIIYKATSPLGAFLVGFVVVLFELPCTGGPYFFVLGLLAKSLTLGGAVPYLLLYNVFFVLPLLLILGLVFWGYSTVEKAAEWKERNTRLLHLIAGIVLTTLGLLVAFHVV
ncbi:hypothetical protein A2155_01540 [candidate division WWE3 bacterium RBG_16_52_45]|nr:MAG: hypothetical protein A2155_01540 [candidate division WWE3 bacterium RBG_16_52_45]